MFFHKNKWEEKLVRPIQWKMFISQCCHLPKLNCEGRKARLQEGSIDCGIYFSLNIRQAKETLTQQARKRSVITDRKGRECFQKRLSVILSTRGGAGLPAGGSARPQPPQYYRTNTTGNAITRHSHLCLQQYFSIFRVLLSPTRKYVFFFQNRTLKLITIS